MVIGSEEEMRLMLTPHQASQFPSPYVGILASSRRGGRKDILGTKPWGADNECFNGNFDPDNFTRWVAARTEFSKTCKFILSPDVVGDYQPTLVRLAEWEPRLHGMGFPVGLALQDGATTDTIPWQSIESVFVGGTTAFKLSRLAMHICSRAKELGKWVHVGRVNTIERIRNFWDVADSFDGSHFDRFWKLHVPDFLVYCQWREKQMSLPMEIR